MTAREREPIWEVRICEMPDGGRWFEVSSTGWLGRDDVRALAGYLDYLTRALTDTTEAAE